MVLVFVQINPQPFQLIAGYVQPVILGHERLDRMAKHVHILVRPGGILKHFVVAVRLLIITSTLVLGLALNLVRFGESARHCGGVHRIRIEFLESSPRRVKPEAEYRLGAHALVHVLRNSAQEGNSRLNGASGGGS